MNQAHTEFRAGPQQPRIDEGAAVVDAMPISALRRLCRPHDYADVSG
ncbi:hypothetical protein I546_4448 [Mycobacterium kansasii 732]|nr:hypothetical protein I546_7325 [Mycobacterium kansasii 732]ETZ96538.1 hypothetical protein I546_7293 [Mycobacterium kansasii 732]EUA08416.1 hypothetical protein I546_4448 [Mycobacterium kansasii 732]